MIVQWIARILNWARAIICWLQASSEVHAREEESQSQGVAIAEGVEMLVITTPSSSGYLAVLQVCALLLSRHGMLHVRQNPMLDLCKSGGDAPGFAGVGLWVGAFIHPAAMALFGSFQEGSIL